MHAVFILHFGQLCLGKHNLKPQQFVLVTHHNVTLASSL